MTTFLILWLSTGFAILLYGLVRGGGNPLAKRTVTILHEGGVREEKEIRGVVEFLVSSLLTVLLGPAPLLFWLIYVPIHDHFAGKAYMRELVENDGGWVPPDLEDEVNLRREAQGLPRRSF